MIAALVASIVLCAVGWPFAFSRRIREPVSPSHRPAITWYWPGGASGRN